MNKCTNHLECPLIIDMDNTEASMVADTRVVGNTAADIMVAGTRVALI
jgi:hypothetical protein